MEAIAIRILAARILEYLFYECACRDDSTAEPWEGRYTLSVPHETFHNDGRIPKGKRMMIRECEGCRLLMADGYMAVCHVTCIRCENYACCICSLSVQSRHQNGRICHSCVCDLESDGEIVEPPSLPVWPDSDPENDVFAILRHAHDQNLPAWRQYPALWL